MTAPSRPAREGPLELSFRSAPEFFGPAKVAVAAAVEELGKQYPSTPIADSKLRARRDRVFGACQLGFELVELAIAEYLTSEDQQRASMPIARMLEELKAAILATGQIQRTVGEMETSLLASSMNRSGSEICEALTVANGYAADAIQALLATQASLESAQQQMPKDTSGASGAIGRLRSFSPDVTLFFKLEEIWAWIGLTSRAGQGGDGLDVFLRHALEAADHKKGAKTNRLDKLREKAKREQSLLSKERSTQ